MASIIEAAGNVLDLPGSMIRDLLVLRNPVDQFLSPLGHDNRTSGSELLNKLGMEGENPWLGLGVEMLLDPTTYLGVGAIGKGAKGYKAASKALKAAGKKAGVKGVLGQSLYGPSISRLDALRDARRARNAAMADLPLAALEEAQAAAGAGVATRARTLDEAAAAINAIPNEDARRAAMQTLTDIQGYQSGVDDVARRFAPRPVDARKSLSEATTGWIGPQMADAISNADDARMLAALTDSTTGFPYDIPSRITAQAPGPNFTMDTLRAAGQNVAARDFVSNAVQAVPNMPATRMPSQVAMAAPSSASRGRDAAALLANAIVSPGTVDMDELAALVRGRQAIADNAATAQSAIMRQTDPMRRVTRQFGGADAAARAAYNQSRQAAPIANRRVVGRRMPSVEGLRNATYRDPNFRNLFGGAGAMLAVDEARANNPYDPLAEEQLSMEDDAIARALLSYQGR